MANNIEKVFTITVDYKTGLENLEKVEKSLRTLKDEARDLAKSQKELDAQRKSESITLDEYSRKTEENKQRLISVRKESASLSQQRRVLQKETKASAVAEGALKGSMLQLSNQITALKTRYQQLSPTTAEHIREMRQIRKELTAAEKDYKKLSNQVNSSKSFSGRVSGVLKGLGGQLLAITGLSKGLGAIKDFATESIKLAAAAEGVSTAFNKLNNPDLLKNLRRETKGTVNDFLLMKSAVRAENFKIPLDQLGSLLKFAQQRAQETGESVDYLTESIINGIGRKSKLILDNLGISAVRLSDEFGKSGDFMAATIKIVNEELEKQGDLELTSADKAQQASVKWENAKLALGKRMSWLGNLWSEVSGSIADGLVKIAGDTRTATEKFNNQIQTVAELQSNIEPLVSEYEELKSKSELTADENARLNTVVQMIAGSIPGVIRQFDKYGNALDVNIEKVKEYIAVERAMLQYQHKEAIAETERFIEKESKLLEGKQARYRAGGKHVYAGSRGVGQSTTEFEADSPEELKRREAEIGAISNRILGAQARLKQLTGEAIEEQVNQNVALIKQRAEFNKMNALQLDAWINDEKNAQSEYLALAKQIQSQKFGAGGDAAAAAADKGADKRAQERLKKETALAYEIEQNKISAMEDGVAKRLAQLDLNNKKELEKHAEEFSGFENYEDLKTEVANRQAQDKQAILDKATKEELELYRLLAADYETAMEATIAIDKKIAQERVKEEKKAAEEIKKIRGKAVEDIKRIESDAEVERDFINATETDESKRKNRLIQNEIEIREEKIKTHVAELEALKALGAIDSEEYEATLSNLRNLQTELINLGKFGNAEGKDNRSFWRRLFGVPEGEEGDADFEKLKEEIKEKAFALASEVSGIIAQAEKDSIDRRLEREKKLIDDKTNSEKKGAKARKDAGIYTEEQYQKELERIDKKADEERLKAEKKAFEDKKRIDTKTAIIDTLISVGKTFAKMGWPAGIPFAAMAVAEGAVRVAAIQSQKFAKGGVVDMGSTPDGVSMSMVNGPSHAQGGVRIYRDGSNVPIGEVEGGEILAVINKRSSKAIQRMSQLNQMGGGRRFAAGGVMYGKIPEPADIPNASDYYNRLEQVRQKEREIERAEAREQINAISNRIDNIRVHVVEYDITDTQNSIKAIVKQASF